MGVLKDYVVTKIDTAPTTEEETTIYIEYATEEHITHIVQEEQEDMIIIIEEGQVDEEIVIDIGGNQVTEEIVIIKEEQLPFKTCPGEFWADALRTVYGSRNLVLGYSNSMEVKLSETQVVEVGPMNSGLVVEIGQGECCLIGDETIFRVRLNVVDYKMSNDSGSATVNLDSDRRAEKCYLVATKTNRVLAKFDKFTKSVFWKGLVDEYNKDTVQFYKNYLEMFYPASLNLYFNASMNVNWDTFGLPGWTGTQNLLSRKSINLYSKEVLTWPPPSFDFSPKEYIDLLEMTSETSARIVCRIERFCATYIFPFITDAADLIIMEERLKIGLSFEYIIQVTTKYIVDKQPHEEVIETLPFPIEPAVFWKEAITTIYGGETKSDTFLLMGVTNSWKIQHEDDSEDVGSLLSGLTVKIDEVHDKDANGKTEFSLVLKVVDYKMSNKDGGIDIELDTTRDAPTCVIVAQQTDRILERFTRLARRVTWKSLIAEYEQNRYRFYQKYLALFYPATIKLSLNIKKIVRPDFLDFPGFNTETIYINRETIVFTETVIRNFPPYNVRLTPNKPIEFVTPANPTTVVIHVGIFDVNFAKPENIDQADITIIHNIITTTTITFEVLREKVTKYIVTKLPFPSCPAKFWAEAIRVLYGTEFVLLGQSDSFEMLIGSDTAKPKKMHSGIVLELGDAVVKTVEDKRVIAINLILKSFKMTDGQQGIEIEDDSTRKREVGSLILGHADEVITWFNNFSKNLDLITLIEDFNQSPATFYKRHIHHFYPAVIQLGLNIKKTVDGTKYGKLNGSITVINRETIWLVSDEVLNFPPSQVEFTAQKPVELVIKEKPTEIVILVENFGSRVINWDVGNNQTDIVIYREVIDYGLTFEIVNQKVIEYVIDITDDKKHPDIVNLPFAIEPSTFWIEAIKTLYGPNHALLGLTEYFKIKGTDGKPIDFGKLMNGLTYRITDVVPTTKEIRITFEIVDFKFTTADGKVKIDMDKTKPNQTITITVKNTSKIIEVFETFKKPTNWTVLLEEYERDTKAFYTQYLELFFPADITFSFDIKQIYEEKTYISKEPIVVIYEITEFPPQDLQITLNKPVQLVYEHDTTIVITIDGFNTSATYPEDKDGYDITVIENIFQFDFTFEVVQKLVTHYIVAQDLPFSNSPGEFWKDALIAIHGYDTHVLFGITNNYKITTADAKEIDLETVLSGWTLKIKEGRSSDKEQNKFIEIDLELIDYKMTTRHPGLEVSLDKTRPAEKCTLTIKNPEEVFANFSKVFNDKNWNDLIIEFEAGPKQFYTKYIELFNPSSLTFSFNTTYVFDKTLLTVPGTEDKTLVNQHVIIITYDKLNQFPPQDLTVITNSDIVLVERDSPDKVIVTVTRPEIIIKYLVVTDKKELQDWQVAIERGMSVEFIWRYLQQFVVGPVGPKPKPDEGGIVIDIGDSKTPVDPNQGIGGGTEDPFGDGDGYVGVPFPLCPGQFWADAVRHIYGHKVLMLGSTDKVTIGGKNLGSLHTGLILEILQGTCFDEGDNIQLNFKITDVKMIHENSGIQVYQDTSRKNPICSIVAVDTDKIETKFEQFKDSNRWKDLKLEYDQSPVNFYKKHIGVFYPSQIKFGLNLKFIIDGSLVPVGFTEKKTVINKEVIWFHSDQILKFPPAQITFTPTDQVILVEKENPSVSVTIIEKFVTQLIHWNPESSQEKILTREILIKGLTFEIVRLYVVEKITIEWPIPELPFSLVPAKLWTEAIKTVYGEHFVFFGLTESYKVKDVKIGPEHNGLTLRFVEVKEDLEKRFYIKFDVVEYKRVSENDDIKVEYDVTTGGSEVRIYVEDETKIIETIALWKKNRQWDAMIEEYTQNKVTFYENIVKFFYPGKMTLKLVNLKLTFSVETAIKLGFTTTTVLHLKNETEYTTVITEFPPKDLQWKPTGPREWVLPGTTEVILGSSETPTTKWVLPYKKDFYDIDFVKEIFVTGLTWEVIHYRVIHSIVSKSLPFSINPGVFFSDAIKHIYGPGTMMLGGSQEFNVTLPNGKEYNVGPMLNGFTLEYLQGHYEPGEDITLEFRITDYKMTNKKGGVQIKLDKTREGTSCVMIVENSQKVIERFVKLTRETGWETLTLEYTQNPKAFYGKYIHLFYPCTIKASINLKYTIDAKITGLPGFVGKRTFINKDLITIVTTDITDFPPFNIDLNPTKAVELIIPSTDAVVLTIQEFKAIWTRPVLRGDDEYILLTKLIKSGVTYDYLIVTVEKYIHFECIDHPFAPDDLPFPLCPGEFWAQAIKTVYGETSLLVGNTSEIEFTDAKGEPIDDGSLLSAVLLKVVKGCCDTFADHSSIRVKFDLVDLKFITKGGKLRIEYDSERKGTKITLEAKNVQEIKTAFTHFVDMSNWPVLTEEYNKSPVAFYKQYISMFFPATLQTSFNVKSVLSTDTIVVNRDIIHVTSDELLSFPPSSFQFHLTQPIEYVEHTHRSVVIMRAIKLETTEIHLVPHGDEDIKIVTEVIKSGKITYEFILTIVVKYLIEEHIVKPDIPELPFSLEPLVFFEESWKTLVGTNDLYLSLSKDDFILTFNDGTITNFGPLLSGMNFKIVKTVQVGTEFQLTFDIIDLKMVSMDGTLEIEMDRDVTVGQLTITTKNGQSILEKLETFKNTTNWETVIHEFHLSPKNFYTKHIDVFFPAEMKLTTHLRYVINGSRTLVTKDIVVFTGAINTFAHNGVHLTLQQPGLILVDNRTSTDIVAKLVILSQKWIYAVTKDDTELITLMEIINKGTLTYVIVRQLVYKYIIRQRLPFPLCPGEFFAAAIKTLYAEGHLFMGITHHYNVNHLVTGGGEVDLGPMLSAFTLKIQEGASWEYSHDKSIHIKLNILNYKMVRRDGGIEIEIDTTRERGDCSIVVNNTVEIFKKFAEFFHEDKWDMLSTLYKQSPTKFYEKYISLFFPATINFSANHKYKIDTSLVKIPGLTGVHEFVTKNLVHYQWANSDNFPLQDMRFSFTTPIQLVRITKPTEVIMSITTSDSVYIYPDIADKAEKAIVDDVVLNGFDYKFVYEQVSRYIITQLPFPTDIGLFWETAIRTVYGDKHLLLGVSDKSNLSHPGEPNQRVQMEVGPTLCGLLTSIGRGAVHGEQITCGLNLVDFKLTNLDGAVELSYQPTKPTEGGKLISLNSTKVFEQFAWFANPAHWQECIDLHNESPKKFYQKFVKVFYPARIEYNMNVVAHIGSHKNKVRGYKGTETIVTTQAFNLVQEKVPYFPPASTTFIPQVSVELVDEASKTVNAYLLRKRIIFAHPSKEEKSEQEICLKTFDAGLTFDMVRNMVPMYLDVPTYENQVRVLIDYVEIY